MRYICGNCKNDFEEPKRVNTTYESYYGLSDGYATPLVLYHCPYCDEENDFDEMRQCEECEEHVEKVSDGNG